MTSSRLLNPQDKMISIYLQNMQKTIESLCKIINTLVLDDQVSFEAYQKIKQVLGQIKYYQKFNEKDKCISKHLTNSISIIQTHSQHQPESPLQNTKQIVKYNTKQSGQNGRQMNQSSRQEYLPSLKIKNRQNNDNSLATIAQKQSQQNLLHNYVRKQSKRKNISKYLKTNQRNELHSKTINANDSITYLDTSRQFDVIREQTRRSLNNPGIQRNKKPLYRQLQIMKGNQQMLPAVKDYLQKHNHKRYVVSKNPNYTITKFI